MQLLHDAPAAAAACAWKRNSRSGQASHAQVCMVQAHEEVQS